VNKRRTLIVGAATLAALAAAGASFPQAASKVYRIGILSVELAADPTDPGWVAFIDEMGRYGYVEGRNLIFIRRASDKDLQRFEALAVELVGLKVDLILSTAGAATRAAKKVTSTIPIVMVGSSDPVRDGLVASLARPGGNVTGNSYQSREVELKRLQILAEAIGRPTRLAYVIYRPDRSLPTMADQLAAMAAAARALGAQFVDFDVEDGDHLHLAFQQMVRQRVDGVVIHNMAAIGLDLDALGPLALRYKLPAITGARDDSESGVLLSYAVSFADMFRKSARYIDKILKGAKPADLPVEQPTKFELVINLKTAKALGLTIPQSLLLRADEVIQ